MFGISGQEFIVLLVVAAVVLGPERLPRYTQQLAQLVRALRRMALGATEQMRAELGPEFDDIDWRKLDPRQYDPRRIVREALADTFDADDPLGMKSVQRDMRENADDVRRAMGDTLGGAEAAVRAPRRSAEDARTAPEPRTPPDAEDPAGVRWDPDTI